MNAQDSSNKAHVPVLVVGGGMAGLSAALLLQYHGVDFVLVDRGDGLSPRPKARGVHKRTTEIFRQLGVDERMAVAADAFTARKQGALGVRIGPSVMGSEPLQVAPRGYRGDELSPSRFLFTPQIEAEQLLVEAARERGGDLRFGTELTAFVADDQGVTATLAGPDGSTSLRADYLLVVEAGNEPLRAAFGTSGWEIPASHHYISTYFRADIAERLAHLSFSQCGLTGETVRGMIASTNFGDEFSLYVEYDPAKEGPADYPAQRCADLARTAVGADDFEVEVLKHEAWDTGSWVADRYRHGRVLIAGDAAHRQSPWGGYAANLGVADVHNLVWKLALVLADKAGDVLLDSYQEERRQRAVVAAQQSDVMNDFQARFGVETPENAASLATLIGMEPTMTRFRYGSSELHVETLAGQTGTRVPHVWLTVDGRQVSTLDVCGPGFTLLTDAGEAGLEEWRAAVADVSAATGLEITLLPIEPSRPETVDAWRSEAGLPTGGTLLIRPDQHVLARSDEELTPSALLDIVKRTVG